MHLKIIDKIYSRIYKKNSIYLSIRFFSLLIPLFALRIIQLSEFEYSILLIKLIGIGVVINQLLETDYHREYYLKSVEYFYSVNKEKNSKLELKYLRENYILRLVNHLFISIPIIIILINSFQSLTAIFISYTYILGEKIYDELQRYLQCCNNSNDKYTIFISLRKVLLFFPIFISYFYENFSILLFLPFIPISIFIPWVVIYGFNNLRNNIFYIFNVIKKNFIHLVKNIINYNLLIQPFAAFPISSIVIIPFNLLSTIGDQNLLASYAIFQRILSIPNTIYMHGFFIDLRNKIIKSINNSNFSESKILYSKIKKQLLFLSISIIINYLFIFIFSNIANKLYLHLLLFVCIAMSSQFLNFEIFRWKISALKRVRILIVPLILNIFISIGGFIPLEIRLISYFISTLLTLYLINKKIK